MSTCCCPESWPSLQCIVTYQHDTCHVTLTLNEMFYFVCISVYMHKMYPVIFLITWKLLLTEISGLSEKNPTLRLSWGWWAGTCLRDVSNCDTRDARLPRDRVRWGNGNSLMLKSSVNWITSPARVPGESSNVCPDLWPMVSCPGLANDDGVAPTTRERNNPTWNIRNY